MLNKLAAWADFDRKHINKGNQILDKAFEEDPFLRPLVACKSPKECHQREVLFQVSYETPKQVACVIAGLSSWLSRQDKNDNEIEDLIIY